MKVLFACGVAMLCLTRPALAEFECVGEISYKWKRADDKEPRAVLWSSVTGKGATEADARANLELLASKEAQTAVGECRKAHENLTDCISTRFSQNTPVLATLSFRGRKSLEDAITADCQALQGSCEGAAAGEAKCREQVAASPTPEEKKEGGKKDAGKKK